jgi:hypothetical protein
MERGLEDNLFTCIVNDTIEGIVYLTVKQKYLHRAVEISYIATVAGRPVADGDPGRKRLRGVGTFLAAGVWMLWKECMAGARTLLLDSEIGARSFYQGIGFQPRGNSGFVMGEPIGRLVQAILEMAGYHPALPDRLQSEIKRMIIQQVRTLQSKPLFKKKRRARRDAVESVRVCLRPGLNPEIARTAREELKRLGAKIPESQELLEGNHANAPSGGHQGPAI